MRKYVIAAVAIVGFAASAQAVTIPAGTAGFVWTTSPTVNIAAGTFGGDSIATTAATGGFTGVSGPGTSLGTLAFSNVIGTSLDETLANFLSFGDFSFSVSKVTTQSFVNAAGSVSASLYLLGTTIAPGFDATLNSVTLTFNSTGGSPFTASATLSNPPGGTVPSVPEPASWAMMLGGFGLIGLAMRRRRTDVSVKFG
jgi:hypothetical protein